MELLGKYDQKKKIYHDGEDIMLSEIRQAGKTNTI